ncbi:hypothetical protein [Paenirhodobacter sp.]|uniref:hypothetical protein n=1 Tax=Paenirhodobacter sp. TaxID=1965326 RepID=UPI003B411580
MEILHFDRTAYTAMQARMAETDGRGISINEYLAAGLFALAVDFSDAFDRLAQREPLEDMQDLAGWIDMGAAATEYNLTTAQIWAGLQECAARGMMIVAVNMEDPEQVYCGLASDPTTTRNSGALGRLRTGLWLLHMGRADMVDFDTARTEREKVWQLAARHRESAEKRAGLDA